MTMHVFKNSVVDWVVAASPEDAAAVVREHVGHDEYADIAFWQLPGEQMLTVRCDDGPPDPESETKTCAEWAAENGRGLLASTEY